MTITVPMRVHRTSADFDPKPEVRFVTLVVDHDAKRPSAYRGELNLKGLSAKELAGFKKNQRVPITIG